MESTKAKRIYLDLNANYYYLANVYKYYLPKLQEKNLNRYHNPNPLKQKVLQQ